MMRLRPGTGDESDEGESDEEEEKEEEGGGEEEGGKERGREEGSAGVTRAVWAAALHHRVRVASPRRRSHDPRRGQ